MTKALVFVLSAAVLFPACVSKKKYLEMQRANDQSLAEHAQNYKKQLDECNKQTESYKKKLADCEYDKTQLTNQRTQLTNELKIAQNTIDLRQEQMDELKKQLNEGKNITKKQFEQIENLTVLSQSANNNIKQTLSQLEKKDGYIHLLQAARTKADSMNLALAVNLKSVLKDGLNDEDIEVKVDKTVVFINISDKMLFKSGSFNISPRASEVLSKVAQILQSRPDLEVMVEGYTDNVPIKNGCIDDNWDLSVKRATSVVRALQTTYKIDPNRMVAAGRGEYNILAPNDTPQGRETNRRTRIILLPKLDQFYELLNPTNMPK